MTTNLDADQALRKRMSTRLISLTSTNIRYEHPVESISSIVFSSRGLSYGGGKSICLEALSALIASSLLHSMAWDLNAIFALLELLEGPIRDLLTRL
jgi:hypothetical protein